MRPANYNVYDTAAAEINELQDGTLKRWAATAQASFDERSLIQRNYHA